MRVAFHASAGKKFDDALSRAFCAGCKAHRIKSGVHPTAEWDGTPVEGADVGVVVGVKDKSHPIMEAYLAAGRHAVFIDKGYTRIRGGPLGTEYWRVSVDAFQPLAYFRDKIRSDDRWKALDVPVRFTRNKGTAVLFAGSSQKFCDWHGLGDATAYAERTLAALRQHTDREIVYRPKPSWGDAVPIDGYQYSRDGDKFVTRLEAAYCLVTYGSNACFEALISGVPTVVLGDGVTAPLSSTTVEGVADPLFPPPHKTYELACALAYCQWTLDEMAAGTTLAEILPLLEKSRA